MKVSKSPGKNITIELKEIAYQRLILRARRHFSAYDKLLSQIINQPVIDALSDLADKTVGRPICILCSGVFGSIGTAVYYLVARNNGYEYNYFTFVIFISAGYLSGLILELSWHQIKRNK